MGVKIGGEVEKINAKEVNYKEFAERYLHNNRPLLISGLTHDWTASKDWIFPDGRPNLHFLSTHFPNSRVQVAECGTREFTDQKRVEMSVSDFIHQWLQLSSGQNSLSTESNSNLYLKDWHFVKEYPEYVAYTTPLFFRDDWLNLYLDQFHMHNDPDSYQERDTISCSDYRFVYMGAKGTWTPLHADVFRSYSWSANVCGRKQWHFLSPNQSHLIFDRNMKSSVYDIFDDVSETKFPGFSKATWLECTQERNEIIFVPSGWYHQVHNLEDTISINHNWFNAYNLSWVWDLLWKDYVEAKECIDDIKDICDDFEGLCQRNLAANTGMNFNDFFIFIVRFSFANLVQLYLPANNNSSQRCRHIFFNLESAREIALKMQSTSLAENHVDCIDLRKALEDPTFLKLCMHLGRTYATIHEQDEVDFDMKQMLVDHVVDFDLLDVSCISVIRSPEDLVSLIDSARAKFKCDDKVKDEQEEVKDIHI